MNDYLCEVVVALGKSLGKYALKKLPLGGETEGRGGHPLGCSRDWDKYVCDTLL